MSSHIPDQLKPDQPLTADYAPGQERPLRGYVALSAIFGTAFGGAAAALRASGRRLPEHVAPGDMLMVGIATHKITRLIAKDKVTSFLRAPFTRFQEPSGQGEVEEEPRGQGLQLAVGELLVCPYCLGMWVSSALAFGLVAAPRQTRFINSIFVAHTISDFLQVAARVTGEQI